MVIGAEGASMGPQLYRCGNLDRGPHVRQGRPQLQWGRNFIVAEINHLHHIADIAALASMGPQLYRCGNLLLLAYG